jgi:hypothetical protein
MFCKKPLVHELWEVGVDRSGQVAMEWGGEKERLYPDWEGG